MDENAARDLAIRRHQTNKILSWVESRIEFVDRDIRRASQDWERDRLELVQRELDRWRVSLQVELKRLRQTTSLEGEMR